MTTNPVRYVSGGRSCIIWFYLFSVLLFGWEDRLISMGKLIGVIVFAVFDMSDIITSDIVAGCWILSACYTLSYRTFSIKDLSTRIFCNYRSITRSIIKTQHSTTKYGYQQSSFRIKPKFRLNQLLSIYEKFKQLIRPLSIPQSVIETYHLTIKYDNQQSTSRKNLSFHRSKILRFRNDFDYQISKEENTY